jgi:hypothetical protein
MEMIALRTGYRTDTTNGLSPLAGFTTGIGIHVWGQELAYAWVPMGDLGNTNYFSFVAHFGGEEENRRNLIYYQQIKNHKTARTDSNLDEATAPDYQQLMQLLSADDPQLAQNNVAPPPGTELPAQ